MNSNRYMLQNITFQMPYQGDLNVLILVLNSNMCGFYKHRFIVVDTFCYLLNIKLTRILNSLFLNLFPQLTQQFQLLGQNQLEFLQDLHLLHQQERFCIEQRKSERKCLPFINNSKPFHRAAVYKLIN